MTTKYTLEQVIEVVEKAVEDYGIDWEDPLAKEGSTCQYTYEWEGKTRHCIVGYVALKLTGKPTTGQCGLTEGKGIWKAEEFLALLDHNAVIYLTELQNRQDKGYTWGDLHEYGMEQVQYEQA